MAGDDILWKKIDEIKQDRPQAGPKHAAKRRKKRQEPRSMKQRSTRDPRPTRSPAAMTPRNHDTTPAQAPPAPALIEELRRAVREIGKEAATHRFTQEEKRLVADAVYTYGRQGLKTSENEIARIAINWLLWDYKTNGKESVLDRVIRALKQ